MHLLKSGSKPIKDRKRRKVYELSSQLPSSQAYDASQQRQASNDGMDASMFEDVTHKLKKPTRSRKPNVPEQP